MSSSLLTSHAIEVWYTDHPADNPDGFPNARDSYRRVDTFTHDGAGHGAQMCETILYRLESEPSHAAGPSPARSFGLGDVLVVDGVAWRRLKVGWLHLSRWSNVARAPEMAAAHR